MDAHGYRADLYLSKGEYDKAIEDYSVEVALSPMDVEVYYDRGTAYAKKGEFHKAMEDFRKIVEIDPTFAAGTMLSAAYFRAI